MIFTRQPQSVATLNRGNPLARGLVFCAVPMGRAFYDYVSGQVTTHPGTTKPRAPTDGNRASAIAAVGASAVGGSFAAQTGMDKIAGSFSLFVEGSLELNASTQFVVNSRETGAGHGFGIRFDDVSVVTNGFIYYAENGNATNSGFDVLGTNSEQFAHRIMITADGTNSRFYAKRALVNTSATATVPIANANRRTQMLGLDVATGQGVGSTSLALAWNRVLSLAEYQMLHDNPWQLFTFVSSTKFAPPTASGTTVTCTVGDEQEAGPSAAVAISTNVATAIYTETEAGPSATVTVGTVVSCTTGAETEAGPSAAVSISTIVACTVGAETEAGPSTAVSLSTNVALSVANENEAGIITTVSVSTQVNCVIGNEVEAGLTASVTSGTTVVCTVGNEQEVGLGATVTVSGGGSSGTSPWYQLAHKRGKR